MKLQNLPIHPLLTPHIEKMWHFESPVGLPERDLRTVVPNARPKLIVPFHGSLTSLGQTFGEICVVGMMESPVVIASSQAVSALGIEFKPASAYRFLQFPLQDITNAVYSLTAVFDLPGRSLQQTVTDAPTFERKIQAVEQFLIQRLSDSPVSFIDHAVHLIQTHHGLLSIRELCSELGYSKRHVDKKFGEWLGISPKMLARIVRFQQFYQYWGMQEGYPDIYTAYYDQAHFIKEFKAFTGDAPLAYARKTNQFGWLFYRR